MLQTATSSSQIHRSSFFNFLSWRKLKPQPETIINPTASATEEASSNINFETSISSSAAAAAVIMTDEQSKLIPATKAIEKCPASKNDSNLCNCNSTCTCSTKSDNNCCGCSYCTSNNSQSCCSSSFCEYCTSFNTTTNSCKSNDNDSSASSSVVEVVQHNNHHQHCKLHCKNVNNSSLTRKKDDNSNTNCEKPTKTIITIKPGDENKELKLRPSKNKNAYVKNNATDNNAGQGTAVYTSGNTGANNNNNNNNNSNKRGTATTPLELQVQSIGPNGDIKKVITLWQNYYPEGGWGWIVLFCTFIIQTMNHGFQLGFPVVSLVGVGKKFGSSTDPILIGKLLYFL